MAIQFPPNRLPQPIWTVEDSKWHCIDSKHNNVSECWRYTYVRKNLSRGLSTWNTLLLWWLIVVVRLKYLPKVSETQFFICIAVLVAKYKISSYAWLYIRVKRCAMKTWKYSLKINLKNIFFILTVVVFSSMGLLPTAGDILLILCILVKQRKFKV